MKSQPEMNWHRLVRYLTGEHAPEEEEAVQAWIVEDETRARRMDELKQIWDATQKPIRPRDVDAAWHAIKEKLQEEKRREETSSSFSSQSFERRSERERRGAPRSSRLPRSRWRPLARVAGVMALVIVTALITTFLIEPPEFVSSTAEDKVLATEKGQRAIVRLADGTEVKLNVDSRLTLDKGFGQDRREVHLEGQAYFEVAPDAGRPFVVHSKEATVEVRGTTFDVEAYPDEEETKVAVVEGEVALRSERSAPQDTVLLKTRYLGTVSDQYVQAVREGVDLSRQLAWTRGELVFTDAPFQDVVRKLKRWYDLHIEVQVPPEEVDRLNATFGNESLREVIKAVAAGLDLGYEQNGNTVLFYRKGEPLTRSE